MYHHQGSLFFIIILSTSNLTPFSAHASSESIFKQALKFTFVCSAARVRCCLCFLFGKVYFLGKYFARVHSLFCPRLIRPNSKVHFCRNNQIIFRGISLSPFSMQKHKRLLSCINSQFFYCSKNQVFLLAVIFNFQKNFPSDAESTFC